MWQLSDCETAKMSIKYEQLVAKPNAKSKVWKHFGFPAVASGSIIDKKKIACRLCKAVIPYSGNTSNLTYHLQREHPREHQELVEGGRQTGDNFDKPGLSGNATAKSVQITLSGAITRLDSFQWDSVRNKQLVDATADFVCQSMQPICTVDEPSFRHLLKIAESQFQLPHCTHFTDKIIPSKYRKVRSIVEKQLVAVNKCTMTTDLWTAQYQQRAYISFTVHFVDNDFKLQSRHLKYHKTMMQTLLKKCFPQCSSPGIFLKRYVGPQPTIVVILWMLLSCWELNTYHVWHTLCSCRLKMA